MIITRTPFRISFVGGGSDLPEFYREHEGAVLSTAINKYVFLSMHPYFMADRFLLKYSQNELVDDVEQIQHRIIRQVFREYRIRGVDFNSSADVPSGTGLGSSSAFTVGLLTLCNAYTQRYMRPQDVADQACRIELDELKEPIGKQDQYASALGGLNLLTFRHDDSVTYEKVLMGRDAYRRLQESLIVFYLGGTRAAGRILQAQRANMRAGTAVSALKRLVELTHDLRDELVRGNVDALGDILGEAWARKKELAAGITNANVDHYYDLATRNGASGGKLLGAGESGFLLFCVKPDDRERLRVALADLQELPFSFERIGGTVIYES